MTNFRPDGHLTDEALQALAGNGKLEELERLEAAEHLAYCDACLLRYTELLTEECLVQPPVSCREPLRRRIRQAAVRALTSRYATAAAAIVLVTVLWGGGVFHGLVSTSQKLAELPERPLALQEEIHNWPEKYGKTLWERFSGWGDWITGDHGGLGNAADTMQGGLE